MATKLIKFVFCIGILLTLYSCAWQYEPKHQPIKVINGDLAPTITVNASAEVTKAAVLQLFKELKHHLPEKMIENSVLMALEPNLASYINLKKISIFELEKRSYSIIKAINTKDYDKTFVLDLFHSYSRYTPSYTINNKNPKILEGYLAIIKDEGTNQSTIKIVGSSQLSLLEREVCGITHHGFDCGPIEISIKSDPYEQYRILMYIADALDHLSIDYSFDAKPPTLLKTAIGKK